MEVIENLAKIDYVLVIMSIFAILFGIKEIIEIVSYFKNKLRIKTGFDQVVKSEACKPKYVRIGITTEIITCEINKIFSLLKRTFQLILFMTFPPIIYTLLSFPAFNNERSSVF